MTACAGGFSSLSTGGATGGSSSRGPRLNLNFLSGALDSRIAFNRASGGTYFDATGTLQTAPNDTPRFDYDPSTRAIRGLLIEEQRTNLLLWSTPGTHWTSNPTPNDSTATANAAPSPDGGTNATKVVPSTATGVKAIFTTFAGAVSTTYAASVYLKSAGYRYPLVTLGNTGFTPNSQTAVFDLQTGTVAQQATNGLATITPAGNGWYRCSVIATSGTGGIPYVLSVGFANPGFPGTGAGVTFAGDGTSGVFLWGAQVEAGPFATSLIQTAGAAATRAADAASIPFNVNAGSSVSLLAQGALAGVNQTGSANQVWLEVGDGTGNNRGSLLTTLVGSVWPTLFAVNGGTALTRQVQVSQAAGSAAKIAAAWSAAAITVAVTGANAVTNTGEALPKMTTIFLGSSHGSNSFMNGWLQRARVWNRPLSPSELQGATK